MTDPKPNLPKYSIDASRLAKIKQNKTGEKAGTKGVLWECQNCHRPVDPSIDSGCPACGATEMIREPKASADQHRHVFSVPVAWTHTPDSLEAYSFELIKNVTKVTILRCEYCSQTEPVDWTTS